MFMLTQNILTGASRRLVMQPIALMLMLLGLVSFMTPGILFFVAEDLNNRSDFQDKFLIKKLMTTRQESIVSHLTDNAVWGEAYENLHENFSLDWAWTSQNMGSSLYNTFGYEGVFVVSAMGETVYSVIDGRIARIAIQDWLGTDPRKSLSLQLEKTSGKSTARFIIANGQLILLSAAWIKPEDRNEFKAVSGAHSVLYFADKMTPVKLGKIGAEYGIENLHYYVVNNRADDIDNMLPLAVSGGEGGLKWQSKNPGRVIIIWLLPVIALMLLAMLFTAAMLLRRTLRRAESMDESVFMLQQSQQALLASEKRFRDVAETATDWIWEADDTLSFSWISSRFPAVTGHSCGKWIRRQLQDFLIDGDVHCQSLETRLAPGEYICLLRCRYLSAQQRVRYCNLTIRRIELASGQLGYRGTVTDVTLEVEAEEKARYLALYDDLTGLPNRAQMKQFLSGKLETPLSADKPLAVIMIDLDKFKPVNDIYGHAAGDAILHQVSARFCSCVNDTGLTARLGGDEFVIIVSDMSRAQVAKLCDEIIDVINQPFDLNGIEVFIGVSLGIAIAPTDADNISDLLRYADIALYKAKNSGRNKHEFYHHELGAKIVQRREMELELREAIFSGQLSVVYQPRYDVAREKITAVEALVRWQHPKRGTVMPDQFISVAEETGLISALTDWVLERACTDIQTSFHQMIVSVNISASEFLDCGLTERVRKVLHKTGLDSQRLEIEITENALINNPENALNVMKDLQKIGIKFLVDDFGTGYASFSYLHNFPFDGIKLDKSFIFSMNESDNSLKIVENMIDLGKAYSLSVTAEGVETQRQLFQLEQLNCDYLQGYHIGRPLALTQLASKYPGA